MKFIFRIFWSLVIISSIIAAIYFSLNIDGDNAELTFESADTFPLHTIPFPAITICPETKAKRSLVNITDAYHNLNLNLSDTDYNDEE